MCIPSGLCNPFQCDDDVWIDDSLLQISIQRSHQSSHKVDGIIGPEEAEKEEINEQRNREFQDSDRAME